MTQTASNTAATAGVHHVGLTVVDLPPTQRFFEELLGFEVVGGDPAYPSVFLSDGSVMITLWRAEDPSAARAFDRKGCVGLHHLALRVVSEATLRDLHERLASWEGASVEFAPEPLGETGLTHGMYAIPGGVRLELVVG